MHVVNMPLYIINARCEYAATRFDANGKPTEEATVPEKTLPGFFTVNKVPASSSNHPTCSSSRTDSAVPPVDLNPETSTEKLSYISNKEPIHDLVVLKRNDPIGNNEKAMLEGN